MNTLLIHGGIVLCLFLRGFFLFLTGGLPVVGCNTSSLGILPVTPVMMVMFHNLEGTPHSDSNFTTLSAPQPKQVFSDVSNTSPFYEAIYWAVEHGITNGTSDTTFSPTETCKRKHIIMFIWRACGKPYKSSWTYPFSADQNLKPGSDFAKAATWSFLRTPFKLEHGIFQFGDPAQLIFYPEKPCDRGEAVIYLWRLADCPDADLELARTFTDIEIIETEDQYLRELPKAVAWAFENGITTGTTKD